MEQPLIRHGSCCLGSINLSEFVIDAYTPRAKFDFSEFEKAVWDATIALDALIDENRGRYPLKEQEVEAMKYRNIGLGIMGLGTMCLKLGFKFGAETILEMIMQTMLNTAFEASAYAAKEKGPYPEYSPLMLDSEFIEVNIPPESLEYAKKNGLRNCSLLTVAPTGSLSTMLGISGGGEAEFAISYNRRVVGDANNEEKTYKMYCKAAQEYMAVNHTEELPEYFEGASQIHWSRRIDTQSLLQRFVDSGISSTINLPNETTVEDVEKLYLSAWQSGLKGCTIYRSGCKREGILTTESDTKKNEKPVEPMPVVNLANTRGRIKEVPGGLNYRKYKIQSGCGSLYLFVGVDEKDGKIYDCFTNTDGIGGCTVNTQAVSRLMSACIRGGVGVDYIIKQLEKSGSCASYQYARGKGKTVSPGKSCPSAIAHILKDIVKELAVCECDGERKPEETEKQNVNRKVFLGIPKEEKEEEISSFVPCPSCGEPTLAPEGGCSTCFSCGWSKCG